MSSKTLQEARRVLTICNACRYCEGFCAVFPAMELRRTFTDGDLKYLANLCHNCRDCYYACQYAPPHDFDLNFPKAMAELRIKTYREFLWPAFLGGSFNKSGLTTAIITLLSIVAMLLTTLIVGGSNTLFSIHTGPGSFYVIISYLTMIVLFSLLFLLILVSFIKGVRNFWEVSVESKGSLLSRQGHLRAAWDVLRLKYLDGGGHGCNYPDDRFSSTRKIMHHAVFYGFLLCLAATTIAAIYDHIFHWPAPYPYLSWPVTLGTVGGILIVIGTISMLYLKTRMDRRPTASQLMGMDVSFNILLLFTSLSGLLLLVLRETSLMGLLLILHLGLVLAFFIMMPIGKFVHGIYRYIALVRFAQEQEESNKGH